MASIFRSGSFLTSCRRIRCSRDPGQGLAVKDAKGNLPYEDAVLDFTNPATVAWYQDKIASLLKMGVGAIKVDFGEAAPLTGVYANGRTGFYEHNLYPLRYNQAVADITARSPAKISSGRAAPGPAASAIRCTGAATRATPIPAWRPSCAAAFPSAQRLQLLEPRHRRLHRQDSRGTLPPLAALRHADSHSRCHGAPPKEPWEYSPAFLDLFRRTTK